MEKFLYVLEEGPFPGTYETDSNNTDWPLTDRVHAEGYSTGVYIKVFETPDNKTPVEGISARGAKYQWNEDVPSYELSE